MSSARRRVPDALLVALMLYPKSYRLRRQEEMIGVFLDATEDTGRLDTAREVFDVAAHGLRVRTALTSGRLPGRLAAETAPFALGAAGGWAISEIVSDRSGHLQSNGLPALALAVLWLAAMAAAFGGRWTATRALAAVAGAVALARVAVHLTRAVADPVGTGLLGWNASTLLTVAAGAAPLVLWAVPLLAAPPDLLHVSSRRRQRAVPIMFVLVMALMAGQSSYAWHIGWWNRQAVSTVVYSLDSAGPTAPAWWDTLNPWQWSWSLLVIMLVVCLVALCLRRGRLLCTAVTLGFAPLVLGQNTYLFLQPAVQPTLPASLCADAVLLAAVVTAAVRRSRRRDVATVPELDPAR